MFVGRTDPTKQLGEFLENRKGGGGLRIFSIGGPPGVGKTFLLDHVIASADIESREYLGLRVSAHPPVPSLATIVTENLVQGLMFREVPIDETFKSVANVRDAVDTIDRRAKAEALGAADDRDTRDVIESLFSVAKGIQTVSPKLKEYIDLDQIPEKAVHAATKLLRNGKALEPEWVLPGPWPDLTGRRLRNSVRSNLESALSDAFFSDVDQFFTKTAAGARGGASRLLIVLDDYEALQDRVEAFLLGHLCPKLHAATFSTDLVVIGRDVLRRTSAMWEKNFKRQLKGEIELSTFSEAEVREYCIEAGLNRPDQVAQVLERTSGYPYLLPSVVNSELSGGSAAVDTVGFFERISAWMSPKEREWLLVVCFLDVVNEDTVADILPNANPAEVVDWFESEPSIRSTSATRLALVPVIKQGLQDYVQLRSPKRYRELRERSTGAVKNSVAANGEAG